MLVEVKCECGDVAEYHVALTGACCGPPPEQRDAGEANCRCNKFQPPSPEPEPPNEPVTRERLVEIFGEKLVAALDRYVVVPGPGTKSPSEPAAVTDAENVALAVAHLEGVIQNLCEIGTKGPLEDAVAVRIVLADRARYQERIAALEMFVDYVVFLFEKLHQDSQEHPLRIAEISGERCQELAVEARTLLPREVPDART